VKAKPGATIVYPVPDEEGRRHVDYIPPDRNAILIWQDQFGSVHGTAFGDINTDHPNFGRLVERFARRYGMFGPMEDDR
jgi:hypothetical protein